MLTIWGRSDDLLEFDGDIYDEVGCWKSDENDYPDLILCSDGTVLEFIYDGLWKFKPVFKGARFIKIHPCFEEDASGYSDLVHFESGVEWCAVITNTEDKQKARNLFRDEGHNWIRKGEDFLHGIDCFVVSELWSE